MPRANIYVDDELHELMQKWRHTKNFSAICANALREELDAAEAIRAPGTLLDHLKGPSPAERALARKYGLADVVICPCPEDPSALRGCLGEAAAEYLDRNLTDGCVLGIAGGRQIWCTVRQIKPRRLRLSLAAIGTAQNDPRVLHVHPNTLVTLLSLIYAPRAEALLVGSPDFPLLWDCPPKAQVEEPNLFVVASCAPFDPQSNFAALLGSEATQALSRNRTIGDFAGVFLFEDGSRELPSDISTEASLFHPHELAGLAKRADARVLLVAGGCEKVPIIESTLKAGLCNVLITDASVARTL